MIIGGVLPANLLQLRAEHQRLREAQPQATGSDRQHDDQFLRSFSETTSNASSIQVLLFIIVIDGWRKIDDMVAIGNSILRNLENNSHPSKENNRKAYGIYAL